MKTIILFLTTLCFCLAGITMLGSSCNAQELTAQGLQQTGEGFLVTAEGITKSKNGVSVKYEVVLDAQRSFAGYKYAAKEMETLGAGDHIALFIKGVEPPRMQSFLRGNWTLVTVKEVTHRSGQTVLTLSEDVALSGGDKLNELHFEALEGFLVSVETKKTR